MSVPTAAGGSSGSVFVVGITGPSCSGKSMVVEHLSGSIEHTVTIHQDDFYYLQEELEQDSQGRYIWDVPEAVMMDKMLKAVHRVLKEPGSVCQTCGLPQNKDKAYTHLLLVEGTMIMSLSELKPLLHATIFITTDYQLCQQRRSGRVYPGDYLDPPGYFEEYVWPCYLRQKQIAESDSTVVYLDGNLSRDDLVSEANTLCRTIMDDYIQ